MEMRGLTGGLYRFSEWVVRLAYIQILWYLFTIIGLGILGVFPATGAAFTVVRKYIKGEEHIKVYQTFKDAYKKDFWKLNGLGWCYAAIGIVLYVDHLFFKFGESTLSTVMKVFTIIFSLVYLIATMFFFPIFVHYQFKFKEYFKYSLLFSLVSPVQTLLMLAGCYLVYRILLMIPGLIPVFGLSLFTFVCMWFAYHVFLKMEDREKKALEEDSEAS